MKVKNLNGTALKRCNCGSWIQHWHNYCKRTATICKAKGCSAYATIGAHVSKYNSVDQKHYIVPFCHAHNRQPGAITLNDGTCLAPANKNTTCK